MESKEKLVYIYKNDFKYRKFKKIDYNKFEEQTPDEHKKRISKDYDTLEYRIKEFYKTGKKSLDLNCLDLEEFPSNLPQELTEQLENLFCCDNSLEKIDDLTKFKRLKVLDLSGNRLSGLPKMPKNVEEISCKYNKIKDINVLKDLEHLKRLDCSENKIKEVTNIDSLQILFCSKNKIKKMAEMNNLLKLVCKNNSIEDLPNFENLLHLQCEYNNIKNLYGYKNLITLFCNNNNIENIDGLDNIETVVCYNNPLKKLKFFPRLKNLFCDIDEDIEISKSYKIKNAVQKKNNIINILFE